MLKPASSCWCWLLLVLTGCAGGPRTKTTDAPDWQDGTQASLVAPSTPLAAPVSAVPEPLTPKAHTPSARVPLVTSRAVGKGAPKSDARPGLAFSHSGAKWVPLQRWCRATGAARLSRLTSSGASFALRSTRGTLLLHPGTRLAQWEEAEVRLGFSPQVIDDEPCVRALEMEKTIMPLLEGISDGSFSEPVVLDPGHGGEDAGASSAQGQSEKEFTLDWTLRLKRDLEAKGIKVVLTRAIDSSLALSNRVALAATARAGLFVSLHFNSAAPDTSEAGLETYCLTPAGMPSTLTRGYPDELGEVYPNNAFDKENWQLAVQIHRALLQVNGHQDRGVRRVRFPAVLRGQHCPAVLVEGGYLSNPAEARLIANPAYRQKLADALAGALEKCLKAKSQ